jgi:putative tricarboxylic transport membrane protein
MRLYDFPLAPAVLGLILGPLSEQQFRRAIAISEGNLWVFVTRPISACVLVLAVAILFGPRLLGRLSSRSGQPQVVRDATLRH